MPIPIVSSGSASSLAAGCLGRPRRDRFTQTHYRNALSHAPFEHTPMAAHMARDGRRRRVLNDEARSALSLSLAAHTQGADPDAPRYGEQASVENHPQV